MQIIPVLMKLRQENCHEFKISLCYSVRFFSQHQFWCKLLRDISMSYKIQMKNSTILERPTKPYVLQHTFLFLWLESIYAILSSKVIIKTETHAETTVNGRVCCSRIHSPLGSPRCRNWGNQISNKKIHANMYLRKATNFHITYAGLSVSHLQGTPEGASHSHVALLKGQWQQKLIFLFLKTYFFPLPESN